ncbi:MAG: TatD family hydrolase [Candidatus Methanomethylophilus sp.]|nr:TatD family hydrolase [Methanomethylophilus sp.]
MKFADAHIHMADGAFGPGYPDISDGDLFFSCSAVPSEWDLPLPETKGDIVRFCGVHPWYVSEWNASAKDSLTSLLNDDPSMQVGEIGLDSKHPDLGKQVEAFSEQISIASDLGRAVNVHNIGCDGETVRLLKQYGKGCRSIILHSFKSDTSPFAGLDCYYSLNPRILSKSKEHVKELAGKIPTDRLLLETDYPFAPRGFATMGGFITELADILGIEPQELASRTLENARRAIQ